MPKEETAAVGSFDHDLTEIRLWKQVWENLTHLLYAHLIHLHTGTILCRRNEARNSKIPS